MEPVGFRGPSRGPIETTLKTQFVEGRRPFFLGDHIKIRTKLWHFSRLFWSSQDLRSVIFELTPGPRSALGAPARNRELIRS